MNTITEQGVREWCLGISLNPITEQAINILISTNGIKTFKITNLKTSIQTNMAAFAGQQAR